MLHDPESSRVLWFLLRLTGGTDAWKYPYAENDARRCDQLIALFTVLGMVVVIAALAAAIVEEWWRTWA